MYRSQGWSIGAATSEPSHPGRADEPQKIFIKALALSCFYRTDALNQCMCLDLLTYFLVEWGHYYMSRCERLISIKSIDYVTKMKDKKCMLGKLQLLYGVWPWMDPVFVLLDLLSSQVKSSD